MTEGAYIKAQALLGLRTPYLNWQTLSLEITRQYVEAVICGKVKQSDALKVHSTPSTRATWISCFVVACRSLGAATLCPTWPALMRWLRRTVR